VVSIQVRLIGFNNHSYFVMKSFFPVCIINKSVFCVQCCFQANDEDSAILNTGTVKLDDKVDEEQAKEIKRLKKGKSRKIHAEQEENVSRKSNVKGEKHEKCGEMTDSVEVEVLKYCKPETKLCLDEAVLPVNDAHGENEEVGENDGNQERKRTGKKKHLQSLSSVLTDIPVEMSRKFSSGNELAKTLGSLGEICRKGRSSKHLTESDDEISLENKALVSGDVIGKKVLSKKRSGLLRSTETVNVEILKDSRMLSDSDTNTELNSSTLSSVISPIKNTGHCENLNQEVSDASQSRKSRNLQQDSIVASPNKNTEICTSLQQNSTDYKSPSKLLVNSRLEQKVVISGKDFEEQFDLFASLQSEDTCNDSGLTNSQDIIAETDIEGDEMTCSITQAIASPKKVVKQTTPMIRSPDHKRFSPKAIPESPTKGACEINAEPSLVSTRRRSSSRTSVDSPMKFMAPEIVEADSSFIVDELKIHQESVHRSSISKVSCMIIIYNIESFQQCCVIITFLM